MSARRLLRLAPVVALAAAGGCFATRNDVRILQDNILTARAEAARADSARQRQLDQAISALGVVTDSLRAVSTRTSRFQADAQQALYAKVAAAQQQQGKK